MISHGFIPSTLSPAKSSSKAAFKELYHFDAKAEGFPNYVDEKHPALAAKISCVQTGVFTSSYKFLPDTYFRKVGKLPIALCSMKQFSKADETSSCQMAAFK